MAPALRAGASPVATATRSPVEPLRYLDVALVLIAVPVGLIAGVPAFGFLLGVGAWLVQRVLAHTDRRFISRAREPRTQLGLNLAEAFGRIWLLAGAIILAGAVGGRADGLTAGLVVCGAYTIAFAIRVLLGPADRPRRRAGGPSSATAQRPPAREALR
jgi:hypothetical protein